MTTKSLFWLCVSSTSVKHCLWITPPTWARCSCSTPSAICLTCSAARSFKIISSLTAECDHTLICHSTTWHSTIVGGTQRWTGHNYSHKQNQHVYSVQQICRCPPFLTTNWMELSTNLQNDWISQLRRVLKELFHIELLHVGMINKASTWGKIGSGNSWDISPFQLSIVQT